MKLKQVGVLALLGMMATSVSVFGLTHTGEESQRAQTGLTDALPAIQSTVQPVIASAPARFEADGNLKLAARLSHTKLRQHSPGKAYLLVEVTGGAATVTARSPVSMAVVLDRSGSMAGDRMAQAKAAARGVVKHLRDGDMVSVVSFDTATQVVVPPTMLSGDRATVLNAIENIALGGDTCVSCGIEEGMKQLSSIAAQHPSQPAHMIVLSDGKTNHGLRDKSGLQQLAMRCGERGVSVTTVGLGLDYEEHKLAAIAEASNGDHHFVENIASLPALFAAETNRLAATVATGATVEIALANGVRLSQVFDRPHQRIDSSRVRVSLGAFSAGEVNTVLLEIDVPTVALGASEVATMKLSYRDELKHAPSELHGTLGIAIADVGQSIMDPVVSARLERSRTSTALEETNALLRQGKLAEARVRIDRRERQLRTARAANKAAPPADPNSPEAERREQAGSDFDSQLGSTNRAKNDLKKKKAGAKGGCGCAGSDLTCNSRCSQKRNGADAYMQRR